MKNNTKSLGLAARLLTQIGLVTLVAIVMIIPAVSQADTLYRQLEFGMSGSDVSSLQTFLATDPIIYPQALVTGYFGTLTRSAVGRFQSQNGLPSVGRVGPLTLVVINSQMGNLGTSGVAPTLFAISINSGRTSAVVNWSTSESAKGLVYYSANPLILSESLHQVTVTGGSSSMSDAGYHTSQSVSLQNLDPNTTYYYMIHTTDQSGNVSVSWPTSFRTTN